RLSALADAAARGDRLCELNVVEQVANVCQTTMVRDAWERGQDLTVHGWVYGLRDGLVRDLEFSATSADESSLRYTAALASLD
ncbi:MAG: carbonic anhydrase, partial [Burkholderiales bacterium]